MDNELIGDPEEEAVELPECKTLGEVLAPLRAGFQKYRALIEEANKLTATWEFLPIEMRRKLVNKFSAMDLAGVRRVLCNQKK